ncbi:hypothetical protein E2C01_070144 [Portunus trituberculatus]|uniref:Uncharacterized protein n=1 Tax=Portunus trituberculatus TaxID=210409 RepID=A0A5B7HTF0_PORTR|nr:hypothetical protein [Portunus trituberculatus]
MDTPGIRSTLNRCECPLGDPCPSLCVVARPLKEVALLVKHLMPLYRGATDLGLAMGEGWSLHSRRKQLTPRYVPFLVACRSLGQGTASLKAKGLTRFPVTVSQLGQAPLHPPYPSPYLPLSPR